MLILTRRLGESVKIGDQVTVTVLGVKGGHVRLGFAAPCGCHRNDNGPHPRICGATIGRWQGKTRRRRG